MDNKLIITTKHGFEIMRIINKIGMKEELIDAVSEITKAQQSQQQNYKRLRELIAEKYENYSEMTNEEMAKASNEMLLKHKDIHDSLVDCTDRINMAGTSLIYDFVTRMPQAEKEIYKTIASIYYLKPKDIEEEGLDKTVERIKEIATSETFMAFFDLAMKLKQ